ncbi:thioredoxin-like 3-3 isoform X3 [Carica papaya]|uniref:thioredoxin-like 3-3 isoform X3 n=1 Tax=Carica papaya TaxID=3649 RepID=UPI000B8CB118|nr:thioredoxin-like 3-3 isoform X3 [Carica papaya]
MESSVGVNGSNKNPRKGLEGTGLELPVNNHGNLKSASSDQNLQDILYHIKSSKTPAIINYGAEFVAKSSLHSAS